MHIEIEIPRPILLVMAGIAIGWGITNWQQGGKTPLAASVVPAGVSSSSIGLPDPTTGSLYASVVNQPAAEEAPVPKQSSEAENNVRRAKQEQEMLKRKMDILHGELRVLDAERKALGDKVDPTLEQQFTAASQILTALTQDQQKADDFLKATLEQMWEAQAKAAALGTEGMTGDSTDTTIATDVPLIWPIDPKLGISATFHDPSYQEHFGFAHDAIDIPTSQGTIVRAAADGVVKDVVDHGLGFNYITIKHGGGLVTLYGHINKFLVESGQRVSAGTPIGYSGGRPGTLGAGLSTGPHLHLGVYRKGVAIDPLSVLPTIPAQLSERQSSSEAN
jgi:murein DD-endopeptidase MepM/ murein hydrolase activator NlpD